MDRGPEQGGGSLLLWKARATPMEENPQPPRVTEEGLMFSFLFIPWSLTRKRKSE